MSSVCRVVVQLSHYIAMRGLRCTSSCDTKSQKTVVLEPAAVRVAVLVSESASLVKSELERVSWAVVVAICCC